MTSPAPASQPTPTEADYEVARALSAEIYHVKTAHAGPTVSDLIAQALADQRAELVGRYEAVATPEQIIAQRAKGWPDFHPETYCHRCGRPNVRAWYAPGDLWNQVMPDDGIVCPQCFAVQAERVLGDVTGWRLTPRRRGELDDKELGAKLLDLADGYDVDSCDPMPVAASRMLLAVAEKLRAAARG